MNKLVEMRHICKAFPGVQALNDVSFDLHAGEVHALLGENGAGKSTLMKVLAGIIQRDSGDFLVEGVPAMHMSPRKAQELGIAIIHQELNMCQHLTVAENIYLGREETKAFAIRRKKMNADAREVLSRLDLDIAPETIVSKLPVSKQQMVEIAKALSTNCKILVMDEPTSALTAAEVEELNRIILELRSQGCGIVYISHRLEELAPIADRVTVLRDGRYVTTKAYADTHIQEIISFMVGREIEEKFPRVKAQRGAEILRVSGLSSECLHDISFSLYEGEILGIAGLMGAGRTELIRALFGADPFDRGEISIRGSAISLRTPKDAIRSGIVCAPEDRKKEGLCIQLPLRENIGMANLDWLCSRLGVVRRAQERKVTGRAIDELKIKTPSQVQEVKNLSGGNQQKVVVGKWLVRDAKVFLFDEPTRGIDVAAKIEIYHLMNRMKAQGIGVLFVSSEMPEVLGMADRILVMSDGAVTGELSREEATQEKIMAYATHFRAKKEDAPYAV